VPATVSPPPQRVTAALALREKSPFAASKAHSDARQRALQPPTERRRISGEESPADRAVLGPRRNGEMPQEAVRPAGVQWWRPVAPPPTSVDKSRHDEHPGSSARASAHPRQPHRMLLAAQALIDDDVGAIRAVENLMRHAADRWVELIIRISPSSRSYSLPKALRVHEHRP
jgi:hypothetical protein